MSALVTGDAVVLGLRPARLPSRALALVVDLAVVWATYILVSVVMLFATASLDDAAQAAIAVALFVLVLIGVPIAVETLTHGRSLGKLACGLRVVRDDGGPIRFRHALVRGAMGVIEILLSLGVVACIASLVSERGRRLGDVFAGTLVVRERVSSGWAAAVPPPPPWLIGRFSGLDLSRVPDALWLAVRQYLTRMRQLDAQVSWTMAVRLAEDMSACTGTPGPEGVPPAAYLAGVVAERQARDARRTFGAGGAAGGAWTSGQAGGPGLPGNPGLVGGPGLGPASGPAAGSAAPSAREEAPIPASAWGSGPGFDPASVPIPGSDAGSPFAPGPGPAPYSASAPVTASAAHRGGADPASDAASSSSLTGHTGSPGAAEPGGSTESAGSRANDAEAPRRATGFAPPA
ncbi:RDD family protein [Streptomyces sp. NPDC001205]